MKITENTLYKWNQKRKKPYTGHELGEILEVSKQTVYCIFRGKIPSKAQYSRIKKLTNGKVKINDWY